MAHGHSPKLDIGPPVHRELIDQSQFLSFDANTLPIALQLEYNMSTPKHQQIRVFSDDPIDITFSFEKAQLSIGFVGRYDVIDILGS
jgi:hypothetical protein